MFIIGLYHKVLIPLPHKIQICTYGQNQINPIKGFRTLGVGERYVNSVHRNKKIRELRELWEKRGLFLFYLPPYSPHLNLAETLWRIMKTKWIRPQDYASSDNLFYTVNRALAAVGDTLGIKLKHNAA